MSKYYTVQNMYPHLKHKERYLSENKLITARSGWEISFITKFLDARPDIIGWSSEDFFIPYYYPVDGKPHRYFPDFYVKFKTKDGGIAERIIEIKPFIETQIPKVPKRMTLGYKDRCNTYIKNQCKWAATRAYCERERAKGRILFFEIITENEFPFG